MDAIANQRDRGRPDLVTPERDISFVVSGPTQDQIGLMEEYKRRLDAAKREAYDLSVGLGTVGLTQEQLNERVADANAEIAHYQGLLDGLKLPATEVGTAHQDLAFNMEEVWKNVLAGADAAGASAPKLADLGTALLGASGGAVGFSEAMAEAAVKAAIFEEARIALTEQWKLGEIDTGTFLDSIDELVTTLETETVAQIKTRLIPPEPGDLTEMGGPWGDDFTSFWPEEARKLKLEADNTPVRDALTEAIGFIEGVPIDDRKLVIEVNNDDVVTDIEQSTVLVSDFVNADYMAKVILDIDSVETGVGDANRLISSLPSSRTIYLNFSSNLAAIIDEARRAGALP
jgi:hypothetical protein